MKSLTGGDLIAGRFMRQDYFTFTPTHHLWVVGNHQPQVRDGGTAFWRRVRLLPFTHVVPDEAQDPHLANRLLASEAPHILAWLVEGAARSLAEGIGEPAAVTVATTSWRLDEDSVARFVEEMCVTGESTRQDLHVRVADLRAAYEHWCKQSSVDPVSAKALTAKMHELGVLGSKGTHGVRFYDGIRLGVDLDERVAGGR